MATKDPGTSPPEDPATPDRVTDTLAGASPGDSTAPDPATQLRARTDAFALALLGNPRIEQLAGWPVGAGPGRDERGARVAALARLLAISYERYLADLGPELEPAL